MDFFLSGYDSNSDSDDKGDGDNKSESIHKTSSHKTTSNFNGDKTHGIKRKHKDLEIEKEDSKDDLEEGEIVFDKIDKGKVDNHSKGKARKLQPKVMMIGKNSAPYVNSVLKTSFNKATNNNSNNVIQGNVKKNVLYAPIYGPVDPNSDSNNIAKNNFRKESGVAGGKRISTGHIDDSAMEEWVFKDQYNTFNKYGYAVDEISGEVVGNKTLYEDYGQNTLTSMSKKEKEIISHDDIDTSVTLLNQNQHTTTRKKGLLSVPKDFKKKKLINEENNILQNSKEKEEDIIEEGEIQKENLLKDKEENGSNDGSSSDSEEENDDSESGSELGDEEDYGPWGKQKEVIILSDLEKGTLTEDQIKVRQELEEKAMRYGKAKMYDGFVSGLAGKIDAIEASTTFHGDSLTDYQGRSWMAPPSDVRVKAETYSRLSATDTESKHSSYLPKRCFAKLIGHSKGVQCIEFFPGTGHLLLSGSMDGTAKIWNLFGNQRRCLRTYVGHSLAIRCMKFNRDGSRFITGGFDKQIRIWDTETGEVIRTISNGRRPYCVTFAPRDQNIVMAGMDDSKIYQWNINTGLVTQEYTYHQLTVNTITFFDEGRKFASTSDDNTIYVWEWDIPVPINQLQNPVMFSHPFVVAHPNEQSLAAQTLDGSIRIYEVQGKFRENKKKVFRGHTTGQYACQVTFCPNGEFIASGDAEGKVFFWNYRKGGESIKRVKEIQAHEKLPCIGVVWHPLQPSWVATCGWDGEIKLWE